MPPATGRRLTWTTSRPLTTCRSSRPRRRRGRRRSPIGSPEGTNPRDALGRAVRLADDERQPDRGARKRQARARAANLRRQDTCPGRAGGCSSCHDAMDPVHDERYAGDIAYV